MYLSFEYVQGGEIFRLLRQENLFPNDVALFYVTEIVLALEYLHRNKIAYRDLKPENLLVFKNDETFSVKICDFTWTLELEDKLEGMEERKTFCGTFEYMAPEMLNEETK